MDMIIIGVYLTENKKKAIGWPLLVGLSSKYNIKLVDIDESNYRTIKYDKIISKLDEFYIEDNVNNKVVQHLSLHNNLIDSFTSQLNLGNRLIMADKMTTICSKFNKLFVPDYIYVSQLDQTIDLKFPVICKPNIAFGSDFSHSMCIVKDHNSLNRANIHMPSLLQNYHEHGGFIIKVYVIDKIINFCIKNSVSIMGNPEDIIYFDTTDIKNHPINCDKNLLLDELQNAVNLNELTACIAEEFNITLFGYDIIKVSDRYALIDVNYFPGYKGFPDFYKTLIKYFIK